MSTTNNTRLEDKWKIKINNKRIFIFMAAVMLCHYTLFDYFRVIISKIPIISFFESFFFPIVYFVLFLVSYNRKRMSKIRIIDIAILLFFAMAILVTCMVYPQNEQFIVNDLISKILPAIPFFLLGLCLTLDEETANILNDIVCIAIIINVIYKIYYLGSGRLLGGSHGEDYSMYSSYLLLPNTMIAIEGAFRRKKILPIISAVLGVIYAFAMGTRGPIVIIAAFVIIALWQNLKMRTSKKVVICIIFAILVLLFVTSSAYMSTLLWMRDLLGQFNVSTRVVDYLISGEMISNSSGRDDIYSVLLEYLNQRPFLGYGVYGEYAIGYEAGAHNVYLQLLFNFGIPVGIVLIISYVVIYLKALIRSSETIIRNWILMLGCIVFIRGIFGSNIFDKYNFLLLGICLSIIRIRKDDLGERKH